MASVTPSDPEKQSIESEPDERDGRGTRWWLAVGIWGVLLAAFLLFVGLFKVTAISYRYNAFSQRTFREEDSRGLIDIWREQLGDLPSSGLLLDAVFLGAVAVVLATVVYGAWLLLVSSSETQNSTRMRRRGEV